MSVQSPLPEAPPCLSTPVSYTHLDVYKRQSPDRSELLWTSPAIPGARHDIAAAREHHLPDKLAPLTAEGKLVLADRGYIGIGAGISVPIRAVRRNQSTGHFERRELSRSEKAYNASHGRLRACGERGNAQLKSWRVLRRLRCSPEPVSYTHLDVYKRQV